MQRLRVIVLPILVGLCASLFTLVATTSNADACSVMAPQLEVSPTSDLEPGDWIKVQGFGFHDVITLPIEPVHDPDTGEELPVHSCMGIELVPQEVTISWIGSTEEPLTHVKGPEFAVELQVPASAEPGWAAVQAGWVMVEVQVAKTGPEPCPVFVDGRSSNTDSWPDHCPYPCDYLAEEQIRPFCPEPCPVNLTDAPVSQLVPEKCPDPCAGGPVAAVWCPDPCLAGPTPDTICPDPCVHIMGFEGDHPPDYPDCPIDPCHGIPNDIMGTAQDPLPNMPCWMPCDGDVDTCPVPHPEPLPVPQPAPEPLPVPGSVDTDIGEDQSGTASVRDVDSARAAAIPPAPQIDFDGCRDAGTDSCVAELQERSLDAIRSVATALFYW